MAISTEKYNDEVLLDRERWCRLSITWHVGITRLETVNRFQFISLVGGASCPGWRAEKSAVCDYHQDSAPGKLLSYLCLLLLLLLLKNNLINEFSEEGETSIASGNAVVTFLRTSAAPWSSWLRRDSAFPVMSEIQDMLGVSLKNDNVKEGREAETMEMELGKPLTRHFLHLETSHRIISNCIESWEVETCRMFLWILITYEAHKLSKICQQYKNILLLLFWSSGSLGKF